MTKRNKIKYCRYLSIDLNTKSKKFQRNFYQSIKSFFKNLNFIHLKDTNYVSKVSISERDLIKIERDFAYKYPNIIDCINKMNWSIWDIDLTTDTTERIKEFKKELDKSI